MPSDRLGLSRLPIRDAASLLRALGGQALGRLLEGEGETLRLTLSQSQQRLLERIAADEDGRESASGWLGWLPWKLARRRRDTVPRLSRTLSEALQSPMGEKQWRMRLLQRLSHDLGGLSASRLPDWAWRIAGRVAWLDPGFVRASAKQISERLRVERLSTEGVPVPQAHPNAWWFLLALAGNEQSPQAFARLKRIASRQIGTESLEEAEEGWVGEWEGWIIRRARERFPASFRDLHAPLRRRVSSGAATGRPP